MDVKLKQILRFADDMVFAKTGKHLDNLQQAILRGSWQGKRYSEIAQEFHCSERHIGNIASKLWQLLSEILDENITKSNLRSTIERYQVLHSNLGNFNFVEKSNIHVCTGSLYPPKFQQKSPPAQTFIEDNTQQKPRIDLRDAPDIRTFYDRTSELATLETSIIQQNCRLVLILGISGIGKSAIIRHLVPQIQTHFDCVLWNSLRTSPTLEIIIKKLMLFISNSTITDLPNNTDAQLSILIEFLRTYRCLIILDEVQQILNSNQFAGNYKPGYENYGTFFKLIGELPHNSCVIFNSWEPPLDILTFTPDNTAVHFLHLTGLNEAAAREILKENGLLDEGKWSDLINFYQGNPLYLKFTAHAINSLLGGKVAEYLNYETVFLSEELALHIYRMI